MKIINEEIKRKFSNKGITLIALVITIIVLLILAGVTIATLTGDNGILNQAENAKEQTEIENEKEQISLVMTNMKFENEQEVVKKEKIFQAHLDEYTGEGKTKVYATESSYTIHFLKTNRVYTIDENGNITEEKSVIVKEDAVAGAVEGTGTEEDPYIIMSIEDLVWMANQVNSGTNRYNSKWIALGKPLDFKSKLSYKNVETTYSYDESSNSYIPDENSETTLMELCTTGIGFIPINEYHGSFDGNGYTISNIYENRSGAAGLFSVVISNNREHPEIIKNLTIKGKFISTDSYAAGIVANVNDYLGYIIQDCVNKSEVQGNHAGGIVGYCRGGQLLDLKSCNNNGKITATQNAGGIIGYAYHGKSISDCINNGEIIGEYAGGIVRVQ